MTNWFPHFLRGLESFADVTQSPGYKECHGLRTIVTFLQNQVMRFRLHDLTCLVVEKQARRVITVRACILTFESVKKKRLFSTRTLDNNLGSKHNPFGCHNHRWRWSPFPWKKAGFGHHKTCWKCPQFSLNKINKTPSLDDTKNNWKCVHPCT